MATAKTKPAPEAKTEPEEEPQTEPEETEDEGLAAKVEALVDAALAKRPAETDKPMTSRAEEEHARVTVADLVREFKEAVKGEEPPAKEAEEQPGKKPTRWIERKLWGAE